jgi:hypothetical protein
VAEIITEIGPAQYDLFEDFLAQSARLLRASVERLGLTRVAGIVGKDPSTISHQLSALDPGKSPSAKLQAVCWYLDPIYQADLAGLVGKVLSTPPDLDPADAMREVVSLALAGVFGNDGKEKALTVYRRMRPGSGAGWEEQARAHCWRAP